MFLTRAVFLVPWLVDEVGLGWVGLGWLVGRTLAPAEN